MIRSRVIIFLQIKESLAIDNDDFDCAETVISFLKNFEERQSMKEDINRLLSTTLKCSSCHCIHCKRSDWTSAVSNQYETIPNEILNNLLPPFC